MFVDVIHTVIRSFSPLPRFHLFIHVLLTVGEYDLWIGHKPSQ